VSVPIARVGPISFSELVDVTGWNDSLSAALPAFRRLDTEIARLRLPILKAEHYVCPHGKTHSTIPVHTAFVAVKSADRDLATWRRVPGFSERRPPRFQD